MTWLRQLTQKITSALLIEWAEARNELFLGLTIYIAGEVPKSLSASSFLREKVYLNSADFKA